MSNESSSQEQKELAKLLGLDISADTFDVAAARLLDAVAIAIGHEPPQNATERQIVFASSIGQDVSTNTKRVASAKIGEALFSKNQDAIAALNLKPGDRVIKISRFELNNEFHTFEQEFVISSIQPNGRVFFKGGNGRGAWPTQLKKISGLILCSTGQVTSGEATSYLLTNGKVRRSSIVYFLRDSRWRRTLRLMTNSLISVPHLP